MTSRLRRGLDELEQSGRNLNESFCQIGTPLPPLADTKKDQGEFVPIWKQEVRDEQGRRRLHGAFTGGFSAGYFNTVGSKEGWTPSTFKSSRGARAEKVQRPEDFMDEEDLEEMRQSRKLENTDTFKTDAFGGTAEELAARGGSSISSALSSLIQPATSSIGQKLLMKLGWRPGQGVGPRVSARKRRIQDAKLRGLSGILAEQNDMDTEDDAEATKHTFAPRDTRLLVYEGKQGKEGLGYLKGPSVKLRGQAGPSVQAPSVSAGFGLGIDDAEEDDLDIYAGGSLHAETNTRMSYDKDMDMDGDGEDLIMIGSTGQSNGRPDTAARSKKLPLQSTDKVNRWHDGRPVLAGFELDPVGVTQDKWFDFPPMPPDWRPRPSRVWTRGNRWDKRGDEPIIAPPTGMGLGRKPQLTAEQRGEKLGEEPIKAPLKSVFEYMSEKSKERLAQYAASKKEASPPSPSAEPTVDPSTVPGIEIPPLSPRTASAALMGFIPFGDDPAKQERYRSYLLSQTHNTKVPQPKLLPSPSVDHINKELQDFSKSANIFKPMSFAMANRFTSSKASAQDMKQPAPGLHMPDPDKVDAWQDKEEKEAAIQEVLTPKQEAARSGMYGNLTRTVEDWYPNKLLCKRFGVADPHPDGPPGKPSTSTAPSAGGPAAIAPPADLAWTEKYVHKSEVSTPPAPPTSVDTARQPRTLAEVGLADDENQGKDILTYKKPPIDIFRAIFQDDDSSDDDDEDDGKSEGGTPSSAPSRFAPAKLAAPPVSSTSSPHQGSHSGPAADDTLDPRELPRPVIFQAKSTRDDNDAVKPRDSKKSKSKKDKERKKNTKILMSFDVGDDEDADVSQTSPKKESSKRKRDKQEPRSSKKIRPDAPVPAAAMVEPDDNEWVEKDIIVPPPTSNSTTTSAPAGRKRASDFL